MGLCGPTWANITTTSKSYHFYMLGIPTPANRNQQKEEVHEKKKKKESTSNPCDGTSLAFSILIAVAKDQSDIAGQGFKQKDSDSSL